MVGDHIQTRVGISQVYLWHISDISQVYMWYISGISQVNPRNILGIYQVFSGLSHTNLNNISRIYLEFLSLISAIYWAYLKHVFEIFSGIKMEISGQYCRTMGLNQLESDRMTALGPNDFSLIYASKYLRYFKDMLYIFPIYGWDRAEKCLIYP